MLIAVVLGLIWIVGGIALDMNTRDSADFTPLGRRTISYGWPIFLVVICIPVTIFTELIVGD